MDMKKILQAMDRVATKPVVGSASMAQFLRVVSEAEINQVPAMPDITGIQPGASKDLGDGSKVTVNQNGTVSYQGGWGTYVYNAQGQHVKTQSPSFAGYSQGTDTTGNVTQKNYNAGPLSVSQTTDATGKQVAADTTYDLGVAKLRQQTNATGQNTNTAYVPDGDTTHVVQENSLNKFISIVDKNNISILNEGKGPHKVALPVQMAMQHYQTPVKHTINETSSVFKTYVALVENDIAEQRTEKQQLIRQYSQRIAEAVLMKERVTFNPDGTRTPSFADQMRANGAQPSLEPASPAVVPLSKRFDPRFKNGPEPYTIDIDGVVYKFAGRTAAGPGTGEVIKVPAAVIGIRGLGAVSVELGKDGVYYLVPQTNESAPSAGLSKTKKSAIAKKAAAGKDIGKPGKSFDKVAKAAGGGEKGEKIAAAAMWKNIKR